MMLDFAVTGLPRSRTAWWAAFLSDSVSVCRHDWSANVFQPADYLKAAVPGKQSGISDTGFFLLGEHCSQYARRILVIHRDKDECRDSTLKAFGIDADYSAMASRLNDVVGLHVDFHDMDKAVVSECFEYLTGRKPDATRLDLYCDMNIQTAIGREVIASITPAHLIVLEAQKWR